MGKAGERSTSALEEEASGETELGPWTQSLGIETPPSEGSCLRVHPHRRKLVRDQQGLQNMARMRGKLTGKRMEPKKRTEA